MPKEVPLRARQAGQVRLAVLDAVLLELERNGVDDLSMADIATAAGISLRTLYRYFPDRPCLLRAAGEHLYQSLGVPFDIAGPDDISKSLLDAAQKLSARPMLAHALVRSAAGQTARSGVRGARVAAIAAALKPLTDDLDPDMARRATAVITHLCSAASWVFVSEESGIDDADAQQAVAWTIDVLVAALRQSPTSGPGHKPRRIVPKSLASAKEAP